MITLGLYGDERSSAAAVAVHGRVVSAVHLTDQDDSRRHRRDRAAAERALGIAGVAIDAVSSIVTARSCEATGDDDADPVGRDATAARVAVPTAVAQAAQFRSNVPNAVVVVLDDDWRGRGVLVNVSRAGAVTMGDIDGMPGMLRAMARVAEALGVDASRPFSSLQAVSESAHAETPFSQVIAAAGGRVTTDLARLEQLLQAVQAECPGDIGGPSVHVEVQKSRRTLAGGILARVARLIAEVGIDAARGQGTDALGLTGTSFETPGFAERVASHAPHAHLAPVSGSIGAALGAARLPHPSPEPLDSLALGQSFTDEEIKAVLDNCRLEYVYEPSRDRLLTRASDLLKSGVLLGWFQGRSEFVTRSLGNRSVLCDPSHRYARENVNVFLRRGHVRDEIDLSLAATAAAACGGSGDPWRFRHVSGRRLEPWRRQLASILDVQEQASVHVPAKAADPELSQLLEVHFERTGVPGLINVPLPVDGRAAMTPRDAVRATFGSPIDVLVIGRFLVGKDYWLLRRR